MPKDEYKSGNDRDAARRTLLSDKQGEQRHEQAVSKFLSKPANKAKAKPSKRYGAGKKKPKRWARSWLVEVASISKHAVDVVCSECGAEGTRNGQSWTSGPKPRCSCGGLVYLKDSESMVTRGPTIVGSSL